MTNWLALKQELDRWKEMGRTSTFWWRDDDAQRPTAELDRLFALASTAQVPLSIAVIPVTAEASLSDYVEHTSEHFVLQHGYGHYNHAPSGTKKSELGAHRPIPQALGDLGAGWQRLRCLFGARALPVLVPPWNRIASGLVPMLPGIGFMGLSTHGSRRRPQATPGLSQVNVHADIIDWHDRCPFIGETAALDLTVGHLRARREGVADPSEPTGLLTHHLVQDEGGWRFIEQFLGRTRDHPGARWLDAATVFQISAHSHAAAVA